MSPETGISFQPYSIETLTRILRKFLKVPGEPQQNNLHLVYLKEYFDYFQNSHGDGAITIVVEPKYTDRDFLEDFAAFYVRCFEDKYRALCMRLHFFQGQVSDDDFRPTPDNTTKALQEKLNCRYLGFLVVRPLPHAFIGRTCLRTYDSEERREYPVTRHCDAHLGVHLSVESLPFQAQDKAAAACATSAIWSALQGTAILFQHNIYSPVEITRASTAHFPGIRRIFPNKGLTPSQMAAAIRHAGLEPEIVHLTTAAQLQATAYAYLRAGIPLLLNAGLFDSSDEGDPKPYRDDWSIGHAVAVTGYSLGKAQVEGLPHSGTLLRATRIDKLYVHDDQLGPFARLTFGGPRGAFGYHHAQVPFTLKSSWPGDSGQLGKVLFAPEVLIVPVYHKIRVDFATILEFVMRWEAKWRKESDDDLPELGVEWDIYLTTVADFKAAVRDHQGLDVDEKWRVLSKRYPRFLWVASAYLYGSHAIDWIFDATDVPDSMELLVDELTYDQ